MRIAFVTDELPRPGIAGHLAMNHAIIFWLQKNGHEVTVLLLRPRLRFLLEPSDFASVIGIGVRQWRRFVFATPKAAPGILARRLPEKLRARLRRRRYGAAAAVLGAFPSARQAAWCKAQIGALQPDAVFADTIFRSALLAAAPAGTRRVIVTHDLLHRRHAMLREAGYAVHPAELTPAMEAALLAAADVIVAIQPEEAAAMRRLSPGKAVCTVPMPALPRARPPGVGRLPDRLVFVGSGTFPNLDGLRWFFAEVWPALRASRAEIRLDLVGDCGAAFASLPPGVARLGRMPELAPVLHRAALAISPLRLGSGLKIKMLDYARHGLVTVATAAALRGFAVDASAPFILAGDAKGFLAAVISGLDGDAIAREQAALGYIARYYSEDACFAGLREALAPLSAG